MFDVEEYLHLALHASSRGQHHAAMIYLKELLKQAPQDARAVYLLAAQHAELGMFERAIDGMKAALAIEPALEMARLQLGLLLLDRHRAAEARAQFAGLLGSPSPALHLYAEGLIAAVDGQWSLARDRLAQGLALPPANPALSTLMQRLIERLSQGNGAAANAEPTSDAPADAVFLGAYRQASS